VEPINIKQIHGHTKSNTRAAEQHPNRHKTLTMKTP